jgi:hypothetical protein
MKSSSIVAPVAALLCLGLGVPLFAAEPVVTGTANHALPGDKAVAPAAKSAETSDRL